MTKIQYAIDELETALQAFERASIPGGGGYSTALTHCVNWENIWRAYSPAIPKKKKSELEDRAKQALANALA